MVKGKLITFEGGEGCGKTTHAKLLGNYLDDLGYKVHVTREPGGVEVAEAIRKIILNPDLSKSAMTELFLYEAARAEFVKTVVRPHMENGEIVISDRFFDSTTAYQGYGGNIPLETVNRMNLLAAGIIPDLTFLIDIDAEVGLRNMKHGEFGNQPDFQESKGLEFHRRVNQGFREIASYNSNRFCVIRYRQGDIETIQTDIRNAVDNYINSN
ncbi:MAG: dTMP kinase [Nanoarchaeota archaeon]|nr:dTMP kinase [Nanoarchaeota archaeon]